MDPALPAALFHDGLRMLMEVGGPVIAVLLGVGLVMGILQAATQINDPAVGFVPRLCVAIGTCWILGSWMMGRLAEYFASTISAMVVR